MRSRPRLAFASSSRMRSISASGSGRPSSLTADPNAAPGGNSCQAASQPFRLEAPPLEDAREGDAGERPRIAPLELELGHVLQIHAPDAGESDGHREDAGPGGEALRDLR